MSHKITLLMQTLLLLGSSQACFASLAYVDDNVLSQLRGRYVSAGEIMQFGIQMVTTWTDSAGVSSGIAKTLTSDTRGHATLTEYSLNQASNSNGSSSLSSVQGVVQLNQQAGNSNQSQNAIQIQINTTVTQSGSSLSSDWQQQTRASVTGTPDLSIKLVKGSDGQVGQSLGQGQVLQYAALNASNIMTSNTLRLQLWVQPQTGQLSAMMPSRAMMTGLH